MVLETAKQPINDTKDSKLVPDTRNRDLKVVRCLYTDVCLREDSKTEIQKRSLQSTLTY